MSTRIRYKNNEIKETDTLDKILNDLYYEWNDRAVRLNNFDDQIVEERKELFNIIKMIIDEVCKNEHATIDDIEKIGEGGFVTVFKIGDKVIKLGVRHTESFPNNPYIVTPILRKEFCIGKNKNIEGIWLEICEYVDVLDEKKVTDEELYELYSKMRDIGLEWLDIDKRNVGRLRKDNIIHWNEQLDPTDYSLNLDSKIGDNIILKKGELVLIDDDFIYKENEVPSKLIDVSEDEEYSFIPKWRQFHKRYNEEHKDKCL